MNSWLKHVRNQSQWKCHSPPNTVNYRNQLACRRRATSWDSAILTSVSPSAKPPLVVDVTAEARSSRLKFIDLGGLHLMRSRAVRVSPSLPRRTLDNRLVLTAGSFGFTAISSLTYKQYQLHTDTASQTMKSDWRRARGRPPTTWIHQIWRDMGIPVTDALELAEDGSFGQQISTAGCYGLTLHIMMKMMMMIMIMILTSEDDDSVPTA